MSDLTDFTDPSTIHVDEVMTNIDHDYRMRGGQWTARLSWPNITVKALSDEVCALREQVAARDVALQIAENSLRQSRDFVMDLRERVATLEGGIREHRKSRFHSNLRLLFEADDDLYALLDASHDQGGADDE